MVDTQCNARILAADNFITVITRFRAAKAVADNGSLVGSVLLITIFLMMHLYSVFWANIEAYAIHVVRSNTPYRPLELFLYTNTLTGPTQYSYKLLLLVMRRNSDVRTPSRHIADSVKRVLDEDASMSSNGVVHRPN